MTSLGGRVIMLKFKTNSQLYKIPHNCKYLLLWQKEKKKPKSGENQFFYLTCSISYNAALVIDVVKESLCRDKTEDFKHFGKDIAYSHMNTLVLNELFYSP